MVTSKFIRRGGLAAIVAAFLFIVANLLGLFTISFQGPTDGIILQNIVAAGAGVLLLLGLIAISGRYLEAMGTPGLVGFLSTLIGLVLALGIFTWAYSLGEQGWGLFFVAAALLANLGWILLGALTLEAWVYPRQASVLIIVGAVLYGVSDALIGSGTQSGALAGSLTYVIGVLVFSIIFNLATGLFGFWLFKRREEGE
jgi:hypothetical protein